MPTPIRILMLEDQPDDAALVLHELRRAGFEPRAERVETEEEFLVRLDPSLDVILSDFTLPGWSGTDALRVVQERGLDVPFLFVSGTIGEDQAVAAMRQGAADYLLKDRLTRLGAAVSQALERRRLHQENERAERDAFLVAALVQSSHDVIIGKTLDGVVTSWNGAAQRLYGWTEAEAVGRHISFIVPPDRTDELADVMDRMRRGERIENAETVRVRKDGARVDVAVTVSPIKDAAGAVLGASSIIRDVTAAKQAQETLRRQVELIDLGHVMVRGMDGRILLWMCGLELLYGWTKAEAVGRVSHELLRTVFPLPLEEMESQLLREGRWEGELTHYCRDGRPLVVASHWALQRDPEGRPSAVLEVNNDISRQRLAEEALRRSEEQYRVLADSLPGGVYTATAEGNCDYCNRWWCDYTGLAADRVLDRGWAEALHPDDRTEGLALWTKAMRHRAAIPDRAPLPAGGRRLSLVPRPGRAVPGLRRAASSSGTAPAWTSRTERQPRRRPCGWPGTSAC